MTQYSAYPWLKTSYNLGTEPKTSSLVIGEYRQFNSTQYCYNLVRISQPVFVTNTVCSNCADQLPSTVRSVQPSLSCEITGLPSVVMGSIAIVIPARKIGPLPTRP